MKLLSFLALFFISNSVIAQYYYNDIIGTAVINNQMKNYNANKVKMVTATGIDQNGMKATNFSEVQEVKDNGKTLKVSSLNNAQITAYYNRFDDQGRLINTVDSSSSIMNIISYEYDNANRIKIIKNITKDSANDFSQTEIHHWLYNEKGNPSKMWRIINNTDSLEIRFIPDEEGLTGDEKTFRRGIETSAVYYYYDDQKRLTDVVRYNSKLKKLIPDMMFEYDDQNRVIQKITTTPSLNTTYLIWRYIFDSKGLKTKEALFNNDKQLTGKIEYSYSYN